MSAQANGPMLLCCRHPAIRKRTQINHHMSEFDALLGLFSLITLIFWMVVGWRAMRAHEQIAEALSLNLARLNQTANKAIEANKKTALADLGVGSIGKKPDQ